MSPKTKKTVKCPHCGNEQDHSFGRPMVKCDSCGAFFKVEGAKGAPGAGDDECKPTIQAKVKCPYCNLVQDNPNMQERLRCKKCNGVFKTTSECLAALPGSEARCTHCGHKQINTHGSLMMKCESCHEFFRTVEEKAPPKPGEPAPSRVTCEHCGKEQDNPKGVNFLRCVQCNKYFHVAGATGTTLVCNYCGSSDVSAKESGRGGNSFRCNSCGQEW